MKDYNTKLNEGHAVGVEWKIREVKKRLKNFKRIKKQNKKARLKPNEALKKVTLNIYLQPTVKYGLTPNKVEEKLIKSEEYRLEYGFCQLKKEFEIQLKKDNNNKNFVHPLKKEK